MIHPLPDLIRPDAEILRAESDILLHNRRDNLVIRILKNHAGLLADLPEIRGIRGIHIVDPHRPPGGDKQRVDLSGERRFSAPVVSENGNKFALLHIETDITKRMRHLGAFILTAIFNIIIAQLLSFYDSHADFPPAGSALINPVRPLPLHARVRPPRPFLQEPRLFRFSKRKKMESRLSPPEAPASHESAGSVSAAGCV